MFAYINGTDVIKGDKLVLRSVDDTTDVNLALTVEVNNDGKNGLKLAAADLVAELYDEDGVPVPTATDDSDAILVPAGQSRVVLKGKAIDAINLEVGKTYTLRVEGTVGEVEELREIEIEVKMAKTFEDAQAKVDDIYAKFHEVVFEDEAALDVEIAKYHGKDGMTVAKDGVISDPTIAAKGTFDVKITETATGVEETATAEFPALVANLTEVKVTVKENDYIADLDAKTLTITDVADKDFGAENVAVTLDAGTANNLAVVKNAAQDTVEKITFTYTSEAKVISVTIDVVVE